MARLLTHHDKFHVHAFLGVIALLHFAFRYAYIYVAGTDSFWAYSSLSTVILVGVHFLLHASSFQFILPPRNWKKPMVWDEFRIHNAIFAGRNLIGTLLCALVPDWWHHWQINTGVFFVKVALILCTCAAADWATAKCGSKTHRTTNAMPYPPNTSAAVEAGAKMFYARAQFGAAVGSIFAPPSVSFVCVLAIEGASLLMTLVRKGRIESRHYHALYTLSLVLPYTALARIVLSDLDAHAMWALAAISAWLVACCLRFHTGMSKYYIWPIALCGGSLFAHSTQYIFSSHAAKYFAVVFMTAVSAFDLHIIPAAFCSCIFSSPTDCQGDAALAEEVEIKRSHSKENSESRQLGWKLNVSLRSAALSGA